MHDLIRQPVTYIRGVLRYRWWLLSSAWVICIIGWLTVANLPDQFQASAKVFVDTHSLLKPLLKGLAVQSNEQHRIRLMTRTLLSRPNLEKVTRMTDLDLKAKTPEEMEKLLDGLKRDISFKGAGGRRQRDNMYTIEYANEDPELAKLVVKSLLTIFVESNLGETRKDQDTAHQFLEQQIQEYEARLLEAEKNLAAFKQKNMGFMAGSADGYYQRLRSMTEQLQLAELELKIQRDRVRVLKQQLGGEIPVLGLTGRGNAAVEAATAETEDRIKNLNLRLDDLLLKYTEQHPDVIAAQQTIKTLKEKRAKEETDAIKEAEELAASAADMSGPPAELVQNVVYQQMKIAYSSAEAEVAAKKVVVHEYTRRIKNLESAVDRVLRVETEQKQLNRNYEAVKENHAELILRLESARMARKVDTRTDTVRFRVIEPPRVPHDPSGPNRILLSNAVFVVGLGFGVALAFLMSQLRPVFDDRRVMSEITGLPVLGSVDMIWTNAQKKARARRGFAFLFVFLALVAVYGMVLSVHLLDIDIGLQTEGIRSMYDKVHTYIGFESLASAANSRV